MMRIQSGVLAAGILLAAYGVKAWAAAPADLAAGVAPQVLGVVTGGNWQDNGKKGFYRAVMIAPADATSGVQVYVQWITAADQNNGGVPVIDKIIPVKEVADLKLLGANLSMDFEKPNEFFLYVEPTDVNKAADQSLSITATSPGLYSAVKGPLPE
jgi:hypothetical protein